MDGFQPNGKRKYKSFYGNTQSEVKKKMRAYLRAKEEGVILAHEYTFSEWAELWFENRIPACIAGAKATAKQYDGNPTVYARFVAWLGGWDRVPTPLSSILHDTDIGAESWKKLRKSERFAPLLAQYGAKMTGRGRNVKIEEKSQKCA